MDQSQDLISRLSTYTLVNSLYNGYTSIKEKNTLLKAGLETAENLTQPVLKKLDDSLMLDQRGVNLLDKIESTASIVSDYYTTTKDNAIETSKVLVSNANKPLNQLLDRAEDLVNKILPPGLTVPPFEEEDEDEDEDEEEEEEEEYEKENEKQRDDEKEGETEEDRLNANPLPRIKDLGTDVSQRIQTAAVSKREQTLRYTIELIQYTAGKIDGLTHIKDNATQVQKIIEEKKEEANEKYLTPAREVIEKHTADVKDFSSKMILSVVAPLLHVAEVLKQAKNKAPSSKQLKNHLELVTKRTREAIEKLKQPELDRYIALVKGTVGNTLHAVADLTSVSSQYLSTVPILTQLLPVLSKWSLSLSARLGNSETVVITEKTKDDDSE